MEEFDSTVFTSLAMVNFGRAIRLMEKNLALPAFIFVPLKRKTEVGLLVTDAFKFFW